MSLVVGHVYVSAVSVSVYLERTLYFWISYIGPVILSSFLSLCWLSRRVCVLLYETCVLRDHVGDAINDGVGNAKLFIDQLVGLLVVPQRLFGQWTCEELEQRSVELVLGFVLHIISKASLV